MTAACLLVGGLVFGFVLLATYASDKSTSKHISYTDSELEEYNKAVANYYRALAELYDSDTK